MTDWTWAAASCRGTSHERDGEPRQDAFRVVGPAGGHDLLAMIACDGAGSTTHGGIGAALATWTLGTCARRWLAFAGRLPSPDAAACWLLLARERIRSTAAKKGMDQTEFATTAVMAVSDGTATITAHVGDGAVVARSASDGRWVSLSWPEQGEFAGTTRFLTERCRPSIRVERHDLSIDVLAVMTDGIERLALDFRTGTPHAAFFEPMSAPLRNRRTPGPQPAISSALHDFFGGRSVNERTDDDKTLIMAVRS